MGHFFRRFRFALVAVICLWSAAFTKGGMITQLDYTASPQSWTGDGMTSYVVSPSAGWTFTSTVSDDLTSIDLKAVRSVQSGPEEFELQLKAPAGQTLVPGVYNNAARYGFQNKTAPGLAFTGNGRGDNTVTGSFTILQANFTPQHGAGPATDDFAVQFQQFDDGITNEWVDGEFLVNASVPEPSSLVILVVFVTALLLRPRDSAALVASRALKQRQ